MFYHITPHISIYAYIGYEHMCLYDFNGKMHWGLYALINSTALLRSSNFFFTKHVVIPLQAHVLICAKYSLLRFGPI